MRLPYALAARAVVARLQHQDELWHRIEVLDVRVEQVVRVAGPISHRVPILPVERRMGVNAVGRMSRAVPLEVRANSVVLIHEERQGVPRREEQRHAHGVELVEPELAESVREQHHCEELREGGVPDTLGGAQRRRLPEAQGLPAGAAPIEEARGRRLPREVVQHALRVPEEADRSQKQHLSFTLRPVHGLGVQAGRPYYGHFDAGRVRDPLGKYGCRGDEDMPRVQSHLVEVLIPKAAILRTNINGERRRQISDDGLAEV
mmetsp:Transcript_80679/g.224539  ORF Transcript_80679/g.224539 Transcript_80679/m.224539 type:complete len:261 (-) Transcript_80679:1216-1998(-)